jgi:type VII secretion-associated protein (TIGR03931 family)
VTGVDAEVVVVVGPSDLVGPREVDAELVQAAFESIDDTIALVDDRVVSVEHVWREMMETAIGPDARAVTLVCPTWWRAPSIDLVCSSVRAIDHLNAGVVVARRAEVLRSDPSTVVVEIAPDFVIVDAPGGEQSVVARVGDPRTVIGSVVTRVVDADVVVIDLPGGVAGGKGLVGDLARTLRSRGTEVAVADDRSVLRAVQIDRARRRRSVGEAHRLLNRFTHPRAAVLAGAGLVVASLVAAAAGNGADPAAVASTWLVEARVAVEVPAGWRTERIQSGPGSFRVQVVSPTDPHIAIHVTQSAGQESLDAAAEVLRRALGEQPDGVFVDFTAPDRKAEKNVITYREIRADHHVDWTVLLDHGVRIAIGCQHEPDRPAPVQICDQAVRTARTLV